MNSQIIIVKEICQGTFSNAEGYSLYCAIINGLEVSDAIVLSFNEIDAVSSSFLNSSIGNVIDDMGMDTLKNRIKITHYTPTLAGVLKKYVADYSHLSV